MAQVLDREQIVSMHEARNMLCPELLAPMSVSGAGSGRSAGGARWVTRRIGTVAQQRFPSLPPHEALPQARRASLDAQGNFPHPLVACLADRDGDSSVVELFPQVVHARGPSALHLPDYDLVVSFGMPVNGAQAPAIIFGPVDGQRLAHRSDFEHQASFFGTVHQDGYTVQTPATRLRSLHTAPPTETPWQDLVKEGLLPQVSAHLDDLHTIEASDFVLTDRKDKFDSSSQPRHWAGPKEALTPLLSFQDGTVLAAAALTEERFPLLLLPSWTPNKRAWLLTAWRTWVEDGTIDAPFPSDGFDDAAWMTSAELQELQILKRLQLELRQTTERLQQEIVEAQERLEEAAAAAVAGTRRLLTAGGAPLEVAVGEALRSLGFEATSMDAEGSANLEDLRVEANSGTWTALVEVKGYGKGGKSNDFMKFTRYGAAYVRERQREPDAYWYVVNSHMTQAPAARPGPFDSVPDHVQTFGEVRGLVIPTVDLFRLVRAVESGEITKEAARTSLMTQTGLYAADFSVRVDQADP